MMTDMQITTPDQELADLQNRMVELFGDADKSTGRVKEIVGGQLGMLYDEAELRGDKDGMDRAMVAWDFAQQLADRNEHTQAIAQGSLAVAQAAFSARDKAVSELNEIATAVNEFNYEHPIVGQFIEQIETDTVEAVLLQDHDVVMSNLTDLEASAFSYDAAATIYGLTCGETPDIGALDGLIEELQALRNTLAAEDE
jgi:hypothetical protein